MTEKVTTPETSFYDRPGVQKESIPVAGGIPVGIEGIYSSELGIGGAYGSWGESYNNSNLPAFVERRLGGSLNEGDVLNLSELGFDSRQHIPDLDDKQHLELELE